MKTDCVLSKHNDKATALMKNACFFKKQEWKKDDSGAWVIVGGIALFALVVLGVVCLYKKQSDKPENYENLE